MDLYFCKYLDHYNLSGEIKIKDWLLRIILFEWINLFISAFIDFIFLRIAAKMKENEWLNT